MRSKTHIAQNLRFLCSGSISISHVCREIGINRQQFNKYLAEAVQPSVHVASRIANYFDVTIEALYAPPAELRQLVQSHGSVRSGSRAYDKYVECFRKMTQASQSVLRRYVGLYLRYSYCFDDSGRIVRSFFCIREEDGVFVTKLIERISHVSNGPKRLTTLRYVGLITHASGCMFNSEYEQNLMSCLGYTAFFCPARPNQRFILGIQSSYSTESNRPCASRVVLERQPPNTDVRAILRTCRTLSPDEIVDLEILELIGNTNESAVRVFSV